MPEDITPPPTWQEISEDPAYQQATPEKRLITFDRWRRDASAYAPTLPDFDPEKFQTGITRKQEELVKAAGMTADTARLKVAQEAVKGIDDFDERVKKLRGMGDDIAYTYVHSGENPYAGFDALARMTHGAGDHPEIPAPVEPKIPEKVQPEDGVSSAIKATAGSIVSAAGGILKGAAAVFTPSSTGDHMEQGGAFLDETPIAPAERYKTATEGPVFKAGQATQEFAKNQFALDPETEKQLGVKIGRQVGGFVPLILSGPLAPATIGMQTVGEHIDTDYQAAKAAGKMDDDAARSAFANAYLAGGLQATVFSVLPPALRKTFDKYLIDKVGTTGLSKFLAGRAAQAGEGAVLGAASRIADNYVEDKPLSEGTGEAAGGFALLQALFPRAKEQVKFVSPEDAQKAADLAKTGSPETARAYLESVKAGPVEIRPGFFRTANPDDVPPDAVTKVVTKVDGHTFYDYRPKSAEEPAPELGSKVTGPILVDEQGNKVAEGTIGQTHKDLMKAAIGQPNEEAVLNAFAREEGHKFADDKGNQLDRGQAADLGVKAGQLPEGTTKAQSELFKQPESKTGFVEAFSTAKGAVTDSYVDSIWQKVQDGKPIQRIAPLENRLREAQKAGLLKSRDDVEAIVKGTAEPPVAPEPAAPAPVAPAEPVAPAAPATSESTAAPVATFKGAKAADWEALQKGETLADATVSTDEKYAKKFARQGVLITFKPKAIDLRDHRGIGSFTLEDVEKVTDARGRVLYEAGKPPSEFAVAKEAAVPQTPEQIAERVATGTEQLREQVKQGIFPTRADAQRAVGAKNADAVRESLRAEYEQLFPGETGVNTERHLGKKLPIKENGDAVFTNNLDTTALQLDQGKRVYIPDEIADEDKVNPNIKYTFDKEKGQYYVTSVEHPTYGTVDEPGKLEKHPAARGSFVMPQEKTQRRENVDRMEPSPDEEAKLAKALKFFESKLENERHTLAQQVGDADLDRLRDSLIDEARYAARKRPEKPLPLNSIYNSVRNTFMNLARRERLVSLDQPIGEDGQTLADVTSAPQAQLDEVEQELDRRGVLPSVVEHDAELPDGEPKRGSLTLLSTGKTEVARENVDTLHRLGALDESPNVRTILENVLADKSIPEVQKIWAKHVLKTLDEGTISLRFVNNPKADTAGLYNMLAPGEAEVTLNLAAGHQDGIIGSLLHELDHHVTLSKIQPEYKRNPTEQRAYENLLQLWEHTSNELFEREHGRRATPEELDLWQEMQGQDPTDPNAVTHPEFTQNRMLYGVANLQEFITEVKGNARFQRLLASIPESGYVAKSTSKFRNVLDAVIKYLNDLFVGEPVKPGSLLDQALHNSYELSSTPVDWARFGEAPASEILARVRNGEEDYRLRFNGVTVGNGGPILNFPHEIPGTPWYKENFGDRKPETLSNREVVAARAKKNVFAEMEKAALERAISGEHLDVTTDGWVAPDGSFIPVVETSSPISMGELDDAGTGHRETAHEIMNKNPELAKAFEASNHPNPGSLEHIYDFMEKQGFVRVVQGANTIYVNGRPTRQQLQLLKDAAIEQGVSLWQDFGGGKERPLFTPARTRAAQGPGVRLTDGKLEIDYTATKQELRDMAEKVFASDLPNKKELLADLQFALGPTLEIRKANDRIVAGYDSANTIANNYARQKANSLALSFGSAKKPTPEQLLDQQATNAVVEAGGDRKQVENDLNQVANSKDPALREKYTPVYQHALDNFDRLQKYADENNRLMKEQVDREHAVDIPTKVLDDYVTRVLKQPDADKSTLSVPNGKGGSTYFLKGRRFEKLADAIHEGYDPVTMNVVDLARRRIETGERLVQLKVLEDELKNTKMPDGRPIIGNTEEVETLYSGKETRAPAGYSLVSTGAKPLVVHDSVVPLFEALYGKPRLGTILGGLAKYAGFAKKNTLLFDSYHVGRIMAKELAYSKGAQRVGYNKGLSILEYADADLERAVAVGDISKEQADYAREKRPVAELLVRNGLNVGKVVDNVFAEMQHWIPFVDKFNGWVFQKLSRGAMLQTALENYERNLARFPELGEEGNARRTAKEYNEVFGNLQNQSLAKNKTLQSLLRATMLAPNWAESQLFAEGRGIGQIARGVGELATGKARLGTVAQGQLTVVIGMLLANQLINYAFTGHSTFENKDGHKLDAFIPGGKNGFWFNPFEIGAEYTFAAHKYLSQHMEPEDVATQILSNKLSPVARGIKEFLTNRDYSGKQFANARERLTASIADALPFPIGLTGVLEKDPRQSLGYRVTRQPGAAEKQLLQSISLKVAPAQSPREEMYALAHPFRADKGYRDSAPAEYTELRRALDRDQLDYAKQELRMLIQKNGKTIDEIKNAVPLTPERFAGTIDRENLLKRRLTPEQKDIYKQAQADHKANARKLRQILPEVRDELRDQLKLNERHRRGKDVP